MGHRDHVTTKAELGGMWPQAHGASGLEEARRTLPWSFKGSLAKPTPGFQVLGLQNGGSMHSCTATHLVIGHDPRKPPLPLPLYVVVMQTLVTCSGAHPCLGLPLFTAGSPVCLLTCPPLLPPPRFAPFFPLTPFHAVVASATWPLAPVCCLLPASVYLGNGLWESAGC